MIERTATIVNLLGLHARAAAKLVRLAAKFESTITISHIDSGVSANARSILNVLYVAAPYGTKLKIIADGGDELAATSAIVELIESGFGEN